MEDHLIIFTQVSLIWYLASDAKKLMELYFRKYHQVGFDDIGRVEPWFTEYPVSTWSKCISATVLELVLVFIIVGS